MEISEAQCYRKGRTPLNEYEIQQVKEIYSWKNADPAVVPRPARLALRPLNWAIERAVPWKDVIDVLDRVSVGPECSHDLQCILKQADVGTIRELRSRPLEKSDILAADVYQWAIRQARGLVGVIVDPFPLPTPILSILSIRAKVCSFVLLSAKTVYRIGLCYGYEFGGDEAKRFTLAVLQAAGANSMEEKIVALATLRRLQMALVIGESSSLEEMGGQGARTARKFAAKVTKRKALLAVPLIGSMLHEVSDARHIADVCQTSIRIFQELKLLEQGKLPEVYSPVLRYPPASS